MGKGQRKDERALKIYNIKVYLPELFYLNFSLVFGWILSPQELHVIGLGKF